MIIDRFFEGNDDTTEDDIKIISRRTGVESEKIRNYRENRKAYLDGALQKLMTSLSKLSGNQKTKGSRDKTVGIEKGRRAMELQKTNLKSKPSSAPKNIQTKSCKTTKVQKVAENIHINSVQNHKEPTSFERKEYICKYCQKSFSRKANLNRQIKAHTGNELYPCSYCDSRFTQKSDLENHFDMIHKDMQRDAIRV